MSGYPLQSSGISSTRFGRSAAPYLLILPTLVLTFWIIGYPLWDLVNMSTHGVTRFGQLKDFIGLANFAHLIAEPLFTGCLLRTLIWTISVVGGSIIFSMPIALILNDKFVGRRIARVIIMLPWAVSLTMTGIVWRWAMDGQSGMVNATLFNLGIIRQPVAWLATGGTAFPVEIAIGILVSIPFSVTVFLGGLASRPSEIYEAARIDGATAWQCWRHLTLPLLRPFINIALVLNVIYVFNSFPLIWVMTQGDPANSTDIFVTWLYKLAFRYGKLDSAAALSLVMFVILLGFTITYAVLAMRDESVEVRR
jgi:multiple sugar transport system permease protein